MNLVNPCRWIVAAMFFVLSDVRAAVLTWNEGGTGTSGTWNSTNSNWLGSGGSTTWTGTNSAVFAGGGGSVVVGSSGMYADQLLFNGPGYARCPKLP